MRKFDNLISYFGIIIGLIFNWSLIYGLIKFGVEYVRIDVSKPSIITIIVLSLQFLLIIIFTYSAYLGLKNKKSKILQVWSVLLLLVAGLLFFENVLSYFSIYNDILVSASGVALIWLSVVLNPLGVAFLTLNTLFLRTDINLHKINLLWLVVINISTFGIYGLDWYRRNSIAVRADNRFWYNLSMYSLFFVSVFFVQVVIPVQLAQALGYQFLILSIIEKITYFTYLGLNILVAVQLKESLQKFFKRKFSFLLTFLLTFYYLQYKINKLMK